MWSRTIIVCVSIFLISACGGGRTVPATQGKPDERDAGQGECGDSAVARAG